MGTPVVTLPGKFLRGRLSLAIYAKAGVMDLVAKDADEYVALALRAPNDRAWGADVMARIEAASGVIYDDREYLMDVERFLARVMPSGPTGP
jgi:predicted O-linked N-acetylglucosamine transferase (SPINDLY family)